jgi:hypothetical protein
VGGRVFETGVVGNSRTVQQRTVNRYDYANVWEIQYGGLSTAEKKPLEEFFTMKWGRAIGFRFFPPSDRDFENDVVGIGDGSTTTFYMRRNYRSRSRFYSRRIVKPVRHTVIVLQDGQKVPYDDPADGIFYPGISGDYPEFYNPITVDWNAGIIGFPTPPTAGQIIRCVDGQYDIPVFFETDAYQSADDIFTEWNSVRVVEIPPAQITSTGLALTPLSLAFTAPSADAYKPVSFDVTLSHTGVTKVYLYYGCIKLSSKGERRDAVDVGNVLTDTITDLQPATTYSVEVRAQDGSGNFSAWSAASSVTTTAILDGLTAVATAAYSMRKLKTAYAGSAIRVKRPSDNAQTDLACGFTKADADAFGANLQVVKWYDQSGNGRDLISQGTNPTLFFGPRPAINFYGNDQTMELRSSAIGSVAAPKQFMVVDPIYGSGHLSSFGSGVKFDTKGNVDTAHNWAFGQNNGSQIEYNSDTSASGRRSERGFAQITSWYESGTGDSIRMDGAVISKASGTNAGDTAATSVELVLGNRYGGTFEGSISKYGEFVLFEGTVSTGDRDAVEASQKTYFLKRKRLVFFGDSLVWGAIVSGPVTTF